MSHKIFVINLGGSSSKFAVYENDQLVVETNMSHMEDEVKKVLRLKNKVFSELRLHENGLMRLA